MTRLRNSGIKQQQHLGSQLRTKVYNLFYKYHSRLFKADILYEICKIMLIQKKAINALKLYHGHLESQFLFSHFHDLSLPTFKH